MASEAQNKELKIKLSEITKQIKSNSKNARLADELIKELLLKKGQLDIVPSDDMINDFKMKYKHDYGAMAIMQGTIREVPTYVFASNGYRLVARSDSMRTSEGAHSLFQWLHSIVDLQKMEDEGVGLTKEQKGVLDTLVYAADRMCNVPTFGFYDDEIMMAIIKVVDEQVARIVASRVEDAELKTEEAGALEDMMQRKEILDIFSDEKTD